MAVGTNTNPATPTPATGTSCGRCLPFAGSPATAGAGSKCPPSFTDTEWAAARMLVLLSSGTSQASAVSYAAKRKRPLAHTLEELRGSPRVRRQRQRQRTLSSLYEATWPLGDGRWADGEQKRRRLVVSGDGNGDRDGYAYAVRRDGR